jgi:hypothetical protein
MQYQFLGRTEWIKSIEFFNTSVLHVERIRYFQEEGISGVLTGREFSYSWDNITWSNWNTLSLANLTAISFRDKPNFYLKLRYSRSGVSTGNIARWYLVYDEIGPSLPGPPSDPSVNAWTFRWEGPEYFLNRTNHFGPFIDLSVNNVFGDASSYGVYFPELRIDNSSGTDLYFKRIKGIGGVSVSESSAGIISISAIPFDPSSIYSYVDSSLAERDASISDLYYKIIDADSSIDDLVRWNLSQDASIQKIDISLNDTIDALTIFPTIAYVDGSLSTIWVKLDSVDTSLLNLGIKNADQDASIEQLFINIASHADGGVWITDISPQMTGNVGNKVFSSGGTVLNSCLTDTSALVISVLALPGHTNYMPFVYINGSPVTLTADTDKPIFSGVYDMIYNFSDASITVTHEDGAYWSTIVEEDSPPIILSANFISSYPGVQTELKAGDVMQINVVTDVSIDQIIWDNTGALTAGTYTASGTNNTFTATIADRGTSPQLLGFTLRVKKPTGSISLDYVSTIHGSVELIDVVSLNNLYPSITWGTIVYPGSQQAIKSGDDVSVGNIVSNFDTISYSSPNGELTLENATTYETLKKVTYLSGGYNILTDNLRIVANRTANNSTTINNTVIWIANTPSTLSVSNPASRLRSGGNDGTTVQSHLITITASQRLLAAPTLTKDTGGAWLEGAFTWGPTATSFTRHLQVHDNDAKGTYGWGAISGTNLAGIVTTTNIGTSQYVLGGFVIRTVTLAAFGWQANINTEVSDYSKLSSSGAGQVLSWTVLQNTRSSLEDILRPQASTWSASAAFTNPTTISILDQSATDSQSQATTFTIQEGI